ncbi:MAG: sigma-E factor negative regulatory protein [Chromatiales bacterium]
MRDDTKQIISAFLDDELEAHELGHLTGKLKQDAGLRATLNRYSLISEAIKGECSDCNAASISVRVQQQLEQEPTVFAPNNLKPAMPTWIKPAAGAAIAATVAVVAVMNFANLSPQQPNLPAAFPVTVDATAVKSPSYTAYPLVQRASTQWRLESSSQQPQHPGIEAELNQFLIDHSEYTTQAGVPGMLPYATFVVYDKK